MAGENIIEGVEAARLIAKALKNRKKRKRMKLEGYEVKFFGIGAGKDHVHVYYRSKELIFDYDELEKALLEEFKRDNAIILYYFVKENEHGVNPRYFGGYLVLEKFSKEELEKEKWPYLDKLERKKVVWCLFDGKDWSEIFLSHYFD